MGKVHWDSAQYMCTLATLMTAYFNGLIFLYGIKYVPRFVSVFPEWVDLKFTTADECLETEFFFHNFSSQNEPKL